MEGAGLAGRSWAVRSSLGWGSLSRSCRDIKQNSGAAAPLPSQHPVELETKAFSSSIPTSSQQPHHAARPRHDRHGARRPGRADALPPRRLHRQVRARPRAAGRGGQRLLLRHLRPRGRQVPAADLLGGEDQPRLHHEAPRAGRCLHDHGGHHQGRERGPCGEA